MSARVKVEHRVRGELDIPEMDPIVRYGGWKASRDAAVEEQEKVGSPLYRRRWHFDRFVLETRTTTVQVTERAL